MAKVMSFTSKDGVVHPDSIWLPVRLNVDNIAQTARVEFAGFHDTDTLASGAAPLLGASKSYMTRGSGYLAMIATPIPSGAMTMLDAVSEAAYAVAMSTLDTPAPSGSGKVSFFDGATDVTI